MLYPKKDICPQCMAGNIVGGKCSHCGAAANKPQSRDSKALPLGYLLHNRYIMGGLLGRGGFGITYTAWDTQTGQRIAVKELFPTNAVERAADGHSIQVHPDQQAFFSEVYASFRKETSTLIQLQGQKGIVRLFHVFEENGTVYYVMEHLDGQDLSKFMRKNGPLTWEQLAPLMATIMDALDQLHTAGLIHRDVTPDNVYMTSSGEYRLIDLGSARAFNGNSYFTTYVKYNFAPCEQYMTNSSQGPWTDIYSLCATCYYALTGKLPPVAPQRKQNDTMVPLEQLCPGVPESVLMAVRWGMQVDWQNRCPSVSKLRSVMFPGGVTSYSGQPLFRLYCISGILKGKLRLLEPEKAVRIGRSTECDIIYPPNSQGISRVQCSVCVRKDGHVLIRDEGSSYGTFLASQEKSVKLPPKQWYYADGCVIAFGNGEQYRVSQAE